MTFPITLEQFGDLFCYEPDVIVLESDENEAELIPDDVERKHADLSYYCREYGHRVIDKITYSYGYGIMLIKLKEEMKV